MRTTTKITRRHSLFLLAMVAAIVTFATSSVAQDAAVGELFTTSDRCMACHNGLVDSAGNDASIGFDWLPTMMANAARDPYWHAGVRRESLDHPSAQAAIEDECSKCHMPMARFQEHANGREGQVFQHLTGGAGAGPATPFALDGVSCALCHQVQDEGLGERSSLVGGFAIDTETPAGQRSVFGPYEVDAGRVGVMRSSSSFSPVQAGHLSSAEFCATCHTLITHSLGPDGEVVGELPEQVPFFEWLHSDYVGEQTCVTCHMAPMGDGVAISSVLGQPRDGAWRHVFRGGNIIVPRMLNEHRVDLGTIAQPQEIAVSQLRTREHLQTRAGTIAVVEAGIDSSALVVDVLVTNMAGHKLPTAYPSRRVWIHLTVRNRDGATVFESGAVREDGSIVGNDNDEDGTRFEPHYDAIDSAEQVQIYESVLEGPDGAITTGLLTATTYAKDNRVLPTGFDKATADDEVAVHGGALEDDDFVAGEDQVRYAIPVGDAVGPFEVTAELWYQTIGFRWAHNLADYESPETHRFVSYFESIAHTSALMLTADTIVVGESSGADVETALE